MTPSPVAAAKPTEQADQLRDAVVRGRGDDLRALMHPQVRLMALGRTLEGAEAVSADLLSDAGLAAWRPLAWMPAENTASGARLRGNRAPGTRDRGLVVSLTFEGDRVSGLQIQRVPPPPPEAGKLIIPPALRTAIDHALIEKRPMLLAYVGADGQPVISFRGSTQVYAEDQLAMWIRNPRGDFLRAIASQPRVAFMYRNEEARSTYQLQGRARVVDDESVRRRVFDRSAEAERAHDFAMLGVAVLVDLDGIEGWAGVGPHGQVDAINLRRDV
ncbi:MAG TPA: pyridoxamine 5'-phosphate oxidase family protein [Burkholderiaceae bacterium]|jgi:hypothetical protein